MSNQVLETVIEISRKAGAAIMAVYNHADGFNVDTKSDNSPVTAADHAAHAILEPALLPLIAGVPVLSEESNLPAFAVRGQWQRYWIIDPLDGTKEFIKRNGEFTVNVALVDNGVPVLGVVHVPALDITYAGTRDGGAFKIEHGTKTPIHTRSVQARIEAKLPIEVVASRSHGADTVTEMLDRISSTLGTIETKNMGSSLKLCLVAEGKADFYPRLALTSEWDTAAAQAVVEAAGGYVTDIDFNILRYNQKDDILNPFFYVFGDKAYPWQALLQGKA